MIMPKSAINCLYCFEISSFHCHPLATLVLPKSLERFFWGKPYRYWSSYLFLNPIEIYAKLNIPIFTAMGELDACVPVESGRALLQYFSAKKSSSFIYIEYSGADHRLQSEDKQYIHDFMGMLGRWLRDN